jgi:hypothetical protein
VDYYGETGKAVIEYYFDHKGVFFAFEKYYNYTQPFYEPGWKIKSVKESRYYFYNRQMIRWLQGNLLQKANTDAYKKEATDLLSQSKSFDYMSASYSDQ